MDGDDQTTAFSIINSDFRIWPSHLPFAAEINTMVVIRFDPNETGRSYLLDMSLLAPNGDVLVGRQGQIQILKWEERNQGIARGVFPVPLRVDHPGQYSPALALDGKRLAVHPILVGNPT